MALQASFDILSRVVERYETGERTVRHLEVTTDEEGDGLCVSMEIPVSLCAASDERVQSALTPETATLTTGGIQVEFSTSPLASLPQATAAAVSASEEAVRVVDDSVVLSVELAIDPSATDHQLQRSSDPSERPPSTASAQKVGGIPDESSNGTVATEPQTDEVGTRANESESDGRSDEDRSDERTGEVDAENERAAELAAVRDESVPPYDDRAYLARLYELCDTFTEMSRVIDMDVSSETVRRYMIEADVHCPASYEVDGNTQAEEIDGSTHAEEVAQNEESESVAQDEESTSPTETDQQRSTAETEIRGPSKSEEPIPEVPDEQLVTDGSGLPSGVELQDVADAVVDSATVYEVQRRLELDREQTLDLLKRLNLIDFATGRVSDQPEQSVSYEQVADRIRETAPGGA